MAVRAARRGTVAAKPIAPIGRTAAIVHRLMANNSRRLGSMRLIQVMLAVGAALAVEAPLLVVPAIVTGAGGLIGGPIPIGQGGGIVFGGSPFQGPGGRQATLLFATDVVITSVPLMVIALRAALARRLSPASAGSVGSC
jgi:hypothetical protein